MSFVRVGPHRKKKSSAIRRRPGWDDSVNDLTVFKATTEEMYLRKEAHKSKNHISVKLEKMRKERKKNKLTGAEAQQLAIMKEVLYDQSELQKVLAKSDTMMAVVKDLFGDDPKRFAGFPNVTNAPQAEADANRGYSSASLVAPVPDIYTRTEKLSDSVMNPSALNDIQTESESEEDSDDDAYAAQPKPISYESKLNLQRFRDFLQEEEKQSTASHEVDPPSLVSELTLAEIEDAAKRRRGPRRQDLSDVGDAGTGLSTGAAEHTADKHQMLQLLQMMMMNQGKTSGHNSANDARMLGALVNAMTAKTQEEAGYQTPPKTQQSNRLPSERTPPSAMNDTKKLKKTKKCTYKSTDSFSDSHNASGNTSSTMNGMRQALLNLEGEIALYERQTGRRTQEESEKTETFSGYTIALVSTVSRLTKYLKETDLRVRTEVTLREQLTQDVYQMRTIIDALATDIILTQEEYGKLYSEHQRYKDNTTAALASVNSQIRELRQQVAGGQSLSGLDQLVSSTHQLRQQVAGGQSLSGLDQLVSSTHQHQVHLNNSNSSRKTNDSRTSTPIHNQQESSNQSGSGSYQLLPGEVRPLNTIAAVTAAATAVMLSPPVRKTRVTTNNKERQTSLIDVAGLPKHNPGKSSDPPHLTQTPPVMNTVSVPRPIPLVQTNVTLPGMAASQEYNRHSQGHQPLLQSNITNERQDTVLVSKNDMQNKQNQRDLYKSSNESNPHASHVSTQPQRTVGSTASVGRDGAAPGGPDLSDLVKLGDETEEQLQRLQQFGLEEAMNNPQLQELMQSQIAELNRQQEEARRRLLDLLDKQRLQQKHIQQAFQSPHSGSTQITASANPPFSPEPRTRGADSTNDIAFSQVSPPISPIPQRSDKNGQTDQGCGIVVSLPTMDFDASNTSLGSPIGPANQFQTVN